MTRAYLGRLGTSLERPPFGGGKYWTSSIIRYKLGNIPIIIRGNS